MKIFRKKGSTSNILTVFIQDNSVTTGAGLGSLDQTSSIVGGYVREGGTGVALAVDENVTTEGTYQAPSTAAQVRIGTPANMRTGIYELHFHNDLFASGADTLTVSLGGATNMADLTLEMQLVDNTAGDVYSRLGAPSGASMSADIAAVKSDSSAILVDTANMQPKLGTPAGADMSADIATTIGIVGTILIDTADMQPKLGTPVADISADVAAVKVDTAAILIDTTGLNGDAMRGTDSAALSSVCTEGRLSELDAANIPTDLDAVLVDTNSLNGTKIPDTISLANINTEVDTALNTAIPGSPTADSINERVATNLDAAVTTRSSHSASDIWAVGTRTLTSFGTLIADIWANATRILTAGTNIVLAKGVGVTGFNDVSTAEVKTQADTALSDIGIDHLLSNGTGVPTPVDGTLFDDIMNKDGSQTYDPTTDSLEAISDSGGGGPTVEEIDAELTAEHGAGSWGAGGTIVLPVMQGEVYSAVATQNVEVKIVKGDTPRIIFDLGADYTGWAIWFAAKEKMSDTTYIIALREVTWSDVSLGQGYIDLSASDTDLVGKFFAELELRQGVQRLTAMKYILDIIDDVIDAT